MRFQSPRGTEDVLPRDVHRWQHLESIHREVAALFGYQEIRTPTFEDTALFTRSVGETSDIVTKEMYEFKDKGGRSMTLKPEGTAGAMRAIIQHSLCPPGTTSRFAYSTPFFRYERPQKGRLREAHQVGFELVGSSSPFADAEVIEATALFYEKLGFGKVTVSLNSIGRRECREKFKEVILERMSTILQIQTEEFKARVFANPLRLIDSKDHDVQAALEGLPPITDFLEPEGRSRFEMVQQKLTARSVPFVLSPTIVRGLDYYTDTVFEVVSEKLGAQNALCGGGRYDDLIAQLGGTPTPSVGVGMGVERALIALDQLQVTVPAPRPSFYAILASEAARAVLDDCVDKMRRNGLSVIADLDGKSVRSQLKQAAHQAARFAILIGEDELATDGVTVRDLDAGSQIVFRTAEFLARLESFV